MLREGIVLSNNPEKATVKVGFPPDENFFCTMKVAYAGTLDNKHFWLPKKGEKVICIMSECHQWGYIIGSAYTPPVEAHKLPAPPEGKSLDDTARVLELKDDSTLSVKIGETTVVIDKDNVNINGTNLKLKGAVSIEGDTKITGNLTVSDNITSEKGIIEALEGDVKDGDKGALGRSMKEMRMTFKNHIHTGNLGAPTTPPPVPM